MGTEPVIEAGSVQPVAMRDFDRINPSFIKCARNLTNMIQSVLMTDSMHTISQRDILNIKSAFFWIECHCNSSFTKRVSAIFSAVARPAEVMMSRLPA